MKIKFKCECGCDFIEEVLENVTMYSVVSGIEKLDNDDIAIDYGDSNTEFGDVSHFQCMECGKILASDSKELYEFLKHNDMLEKN